MLASSRDDFLEVTQALLRAGADINAANSLGMTALLIAIAGGQIKTADLLINSGANSPRSTVLWPWRC